MKKDIITILKEKFPDHIFEDRNGDLLLDGVFAGWTTVMNEDINSYLALDSEKLLIKMIGEEIERRKRRKS